MTARQLSALDSDGVNMGQSATDKIGFYGFTPVVQPSGSTQAAVSTTTSSAASTTTVTTASTTTSPAGFATTTQANDIASLVDALRTGYNIIRPLCYQNGVLLNQIRSDLVTLGLIKGAA